MAETDGLGQSHRIAPMAGRAKFDFVLDEDEYGEFCVVPLSGGKFYAKIDPEDYEEISRYAWREKNTRKATRSQVTQ